jgi:uncharacterized protein (DUF433 family)
MGAVEKVVAAAFSEEHTSRLTGITRSQLRYWDREDFYRPSFGDPNRRVAFSRIYSFKDIVALRVLNVLRNQFGVSLQHLREVSKKLALVMAEDRWTGVRLWVLKKRVVWQEPGTERPQEVLSGQYVVPVVLDMVVADTKNDVAKLNQRDESMVGRIERHRYINHNAPVIAGTRIPVATIQRFAKAGYTTEQIIKEYPDITAKDIEAALAYDLRNAA